MVISDSLTNSNKWNLEMLTKVKSVSPLQTHFQMNYIRFDINQSKLKHIPLLCVRSKEV